MAQTDMNLTRRKLIDSICGLAPIYVFSIFLELKIDGATWLKYVFGIVAFIILGVIYDTVFKGIFCPKDVDTEPITGTRKFLTYMSVFLFNLIGIVIFAVLPIGIVTNLILSILVNFALTMALCYRVAKK